MFTFRLPTVAVLSLLLSVVAGCSADTTDPAELHRNGLGAVEESAIRAAIVGEDIEIQVPLERLRSGTLSGSLEIALLEVGGGEPVEVGSTNARFAQTDRTEEHRVVVAGAGAGLERVDAATLVIGWRVRLSGGDLYGNRSLYASLGSLDVQLRGPSELAPGARSPLRVIVRDPESSTVITGAEVRAVLEVDMGEEATERHELFRGLTDARGEVLEQIALPEGVDAGTIRVTVTHDGAQIWATHALETHVDNQVYLSTDKTIYKPGQDVHLRFLALEGPDRTPVASRAVSFEARDAEGNKVFRRSADTDTFGVASIIVPTDTRVNEGVWTFTAEIDGRRSEVQLPVERYNLPRMTVSVQTDREFALPGDTIHGQVDAFYVFGEPVAGAHVSLDARTAAGLSVGFVSGMTDDEGHYDFELTVPASLDTPDLEDRGDTLALNAEVTDTAAQVERGTGTVALAAAPILINMLADLAALIPGEDNLVYLTVSDPLGRPLLADLEVSGVEASGDLATGASGIAELRLTPAAGETVTLQITATDGAGRSHTRQFNLASGEDSRLGIRSDRAVYRAGETARLRLISDAPGRVYLDVYRGATGIMSTTVEITGESAEVALPLTDEMRGLLVVDALAVTADGTFRSSRPILVDPEGHLEISLVADRETYSPGQEARVDVRVTDADGNPQATSLGLSVVNEATFALGGEPTTSIRQLSGIDERVLPGTVNVFGRSATDLLNMEDATEREQLARLLFARAGEVDAPNFSYDALGEELPQVVSSLARKVSFDANALLAELAPVVNNRLLTRDNAPWMIRTYHMIDPFGRPYRKEVDDSAGLVLVMISDGPDELPFTDDDVTVRENMEWIFYGGYGDEDTAFAGGPRAEGDRAAGAAPPADGLEDSADASGGGESGTRVRADFRETVYVNPTLVTDASGTTSITFPLADSITTWRVSADGSTRDGQLGSAQHRFRTFQSFFVDFNMPTRMTAGDTIELPAVIYNYLDEPVDVTVTLDDEAWFELDSPRTQTLSLLPSEVRSAKFRLRITRAGEHALTLRGSAGEVSDALVRIAQVDPEGEPQDESASARLNGSSTHSFNFPVDTVEGGAMLDLVLTPGFAAEAAQGMESLMQEPNGCFEQTTSSAWPNTLVAGYLEMTGQMTPELREQSIGLVTRGYQRLLTFESPTGGFNWWGDSDPGNRILSAIMIWHLKDLESLIEIDENVRDRTLDWLLAQQNTDGSWDAGDALHAGNEVLGTSVARTTAFIAWALAHTGWADAAVGQAARFLGTNLPDESDLYANALVANALALADRTGAATSTVLRRLDGMGETTENGGILWPTETPSWTGSAGDAAAIETTGLVAYAMMQADAYPDDAAGAMRFIVTNKDSVGTWYNTQATMNALRALSAAASPRGSDAVGTLTVTVNGTVAHVIDVNESNGDLLRSFDLAAFARLGDNTVRVDMAGTGEVSYRITRRAYLPRLPSPGGPLALTVDYDTTSTTLGSPVTVTARARNNDEVVRNQVIVRIGRAPGFVPRTEDLEVMVAAGLVSRFEVREDDVTFYLMDVAAGESRELVFRMTPSLVLEATAPASSVYAYYEPELRQMVPAQLMVVTAR